MPNRIGQHNFSKGEIAEELVARIDVAAYSTALRRAENVIILKYGGVTKRPGTRLVAEVYADEGVRLMPFQFSLQQTYALEMGQGYMRPAANGGLVLEELLTVTGVTLGSTTIIEAAYHAYDVGDQVYFDGVEGTTELNGRIGRVLSAPDGDHFEVDINSTNFTPFTGDDGGITRSGTPPPPPPPPPVPPPSPTPTPPPTGGGGGGGEYCIADDTMVLLADGTETQARFLKVGTMVRTRHHKTLAWGDYPVAAITFAWEPVYKADGFPRATPSHRFWIDGAWKTMREIGEPDGKAWVAKITVKRARTYVSAGVLSHNLKQNQEPL